ncbi:MAG: DUF1592 domain-containing protein [Phycisphaerales bacterium]|nr:DUF1592 domain-containing protein [Phycisphaerales bacterium]
MLTLGLIIALGLNLPQEDSAGALFTAYCIDCHESPGPKGDLDLAAVMADPAGTSTATWTTIEAQLRGRTMPPSKARHRPDDAEYLAMVAWVTAQTATPGSRQVTLRRLNATEYRNTIRDLLDVDFDADAFFPDDDVGYGFDTIGDVLTMSPLLTERYLDAAELIASDAIADPDNPALPGRRLSGLELGARSNQGVRLNSRGAATGTFDLPRDGQYRIRFGAWGDQAGDEPVRLAIRVDKKPLALIDVPETRDAPGVHEIEVPLERGARVVEVFFTNDYFRPQHPDPSQRDRNAVVEWIEVKGPLDEPIIGAFQRDLPPVESTTTGEDWLREVLGTTLPRIWRGPVAEEDREALIAMVLASHSPGTAPEKLLRTALATALVSPRFLYRFEIEPGEESSPLEPHELATRLSYFLWSSTPPGWLLDMASAGQLDQPDGRAEAVERLLADERSRALAANFATQWLQVRDLPTRRPDPDRYPGVDELLLQSMQDETIYFFDDIMRTDHDVDRLMNADFTWIDARLADHYGLDAPSDEGFQRVDLVGTGHRGGLLNHASIMTATSNPTRTSIVKRGKWVLEALLDQPPPPPPPGLDGLPSDGGKSVASLREQMERHRADPSCASCHARMDALGFALEHLDAVGRWRQDDGGAPIDASGELPDGRRINGPDELRVVLLADPALRRSLASHLLIYALGRGLMPADEADVAALVEALSLEPTLRRLIHEIVELKTFRMRTGRADL